MPRRDIGTTDARKHKPRKQAKSKLRTVKAPAGDVASSGGDYGRRKAAPKVKRVLKRIETRQHQAHDTKGDRDLERAKRFLDAHPEILHPPKKKKGGGLLDSAIIGGIATAVPGLSTAAAVADKTLGTHILPGAVKAAKNAPADAADLAVSTPTSVAHLASTAVHHPERLPGELLAPYKELLKHPGKFVTEKPVSTLLMVAPAGRAPGLAAGKALRVAGKQTLKRADATLPGTALREARTGSRDAVVRHLQARADAKEGERTMTVRQVQKRVDEAFGASQKKRGRVEHAVMRKAKEKSKELPKAQRAEFLAKQQEAAKSAARKTARRDFAREFGSTAHRDEASGAIVKPKQAPEGVLHPAREDAEAVANALNRKPLTLEHGGFTRLERAFPLAREPRTVKWVVSKAGDKYAVVPDFVAERLRKHGGVGTGKAPGSRLLRQSRGMFTRTVLPYRPTWLSGQAIEGTVRAAVQGAGPTSLLRARKLKRADPETFKALSDRAVPAGKIGKVMKEFAGERKTLAEDFPGNPVAHALTQLGKAPGIKQVRGLHHAVSNAVFTHVNGNMLEAFPQTVMLGRALKKSPLMERSILGLSDKAIADAAKGLRETPAQVALARSVQRAYGKYSNFGPGLREAIVHWTPFVPWSLNAVRFLTSVLPKDHPVISALIADANAASEDWRKAHRLSLRDSNKLPFFDMGGYPIDAGKSVLRIGHYTPFGVAVDPTGGLANMVLPQFSGLYGAIKYGLDWKGQPLRHDDGTPYTDAETWLYGLQQLGEAMVPAAQQTVEIATAKDKPAAVKHQLRLLSSTRVKPKDQDAGPLGDLAKKYGLGSSSGNLDDLAKKYGLGGS